MKKIQKNVNKCWIQHFGCSTKSSSLLDTALDPVLLDLALHMCHEDIHDTLAKLMRRSFWFQIWAQKDNGKRVFWKLNHMHLSSPPRYLG